MVSAYHASSNRPQNAVSIRAPVVSVMKEASECREK